MADINFEDIAVKVGEAMDSITQQLRLVSILAEIPELVDNVDWPVADRIEDIKNHPDPADAETREAAMAAAADLIASVLAFDVFSAK